MTSYAQDKEDLILAEILKDVVNGFYIDVGANDPELFSVTKLFYDCGWHGINIEPLPDMFYKLCCARNRDINLNMAAGVNFDMLELNIAGMGSSFIEGLAESYKKVLVLVLPLRNILQSVNPKEIHFLKVDVEGFEKNVLMGMDWNYRPWVICMESTIPGTLEPCYYEWEHFLTDKGYVLYCEHGINRFYVDMRNHPELLEGKDEAH